MGFQVIFSLAEAREKGLQVIREAGFREEYDEFHEVLVKIPTMVGRVVYAEDMVYRDYAAWTEDRVCTDAKDPRVKEVLDKLGIAYVEQ